MNYPYNRETLEMMAIRFGLGLAIVAALCTTSNDTTAGPLPSTEEFHGIVSGCAAGMDLEVGGELLNSISDLYDGEESKANFELRLRTEFLERLPKQDRIIAYELYTKCITKLLAQDEDDAGQPEGSTTVSIDISDEAQIEGGVQAAGRDIVNEYNFDEAERREALKITTEVGKDCDRYHAKVLNVSATSDPMLLTSSDFVHGMHYHHASNLFGDKVHEKLTSDLDLIRDLNMQTFQALLTLNQTAMFAAASVQPNKELAVMREQATQKFDTLKPQLLSSVESHCQFLRILKEQLSMR